VHKRSRERERGRGRGRETLKTVADSRLPGGASGAKHCVFEGERERERERRVCACQKIGNMCVRVCVIVDD